MSDERNEYSELPGELADDLRAAYLGSGGEGPDASVDSAVLGAYRRRMAGRRRYRWAAWSAAAAGVAIVIGGATWWQVGSSRAVAYTPTGDIRDAFYLARQLAAGRPEEAGMWDRNGDGRVNQEDVRALALAAVTVSTGEKQ